MAKGQKRGNRETKKPKAEKKPAAAAETSRFQQPTRVPPTKGGAK
jgi:hypothetical protein